MNVEPGRFSKIGVDTADDAFDLMILLFYIEKEIRNAKI
jgi:hypothetical protein